MKHQIAMLGTSLTMRVQWTELLGREGVLNRGVSGDITEGIMARVDEVIEKRPLICFIEGGSNDIDMDIPTATIVKNLGQTAFKLRAANIIPVLFAVPHVSVLYPDHAVFNQKVNEVNKKLHDLARRDGIHMIDLTAKIGNGAQTEERYTARDGMHLAPAVYQLWSQAVMQQLAANNL